MLEACLVCLQRGRQGCWQALKDLHRSPWGQPVHGINKAVNSAAAKVLQRKTEWGSSLSPPTPAQRYVPKLSRKSKGLGITAKGPAACQGKDSKFKAGTCFFYAHRDPKALARSSTDSGRIHLRSGTREFCLCAPKTIPIAVVSL